MIQVALVQGVMVTVFGALALLNSTSSGASLLLGGFSVVLPNLLFAWRMKMATAEQAAVVWMAGELVKLMLTVALLVLAARWLETPIWPALLAGVVVAVLSLFWAPLTLGHARRRQDAHRIDGRLRQMSESKDTK